DGCQEMPGIDALAQIGVIDRDGDRRLAVAVDDAGNAASATLRPGSPLAAFRARRRLDLMDGSHDVVLVSTRIVKGLRGMPPGVLGPRPRRRPVHRPAVAGL